ncbi:hypothetical protein GPECTOR_23g145 [Gonium pectorale]|uniref:Uncharacterized protein n=1 Tax=Gonium pectorale TaxID=33097 RepID=A0A150GI68_GONPE|nr:hypothetical protein GPECTOR_23g145 [Gonium pectorale]|eukprot:KXZ49060.1 hypothetical protein GPECTOR_23g145 [Gonium pectorale]
MDLTSLYGERQTCLVQQLEPKVQDEVSECIQKLENIEDRQFTQMQAAVRRANVLAGSRVHVKDFRFWVYQDLIGLDPTVKQRYPSVDTYMSALIDEYKEHKAGLIQARSLFKKWCKSVKRLGLEPEEWVKRKVFNSDSNATSHRKFTLEQLATEVFPPDLEACRHILLKAAKKVQELEQRGAPMALPEDPEDALEPF